jgi:predicted secreted protein
MKRWIWGLAAGLLLLAACAPQPLVSMGLQETAVPQTAAKEVPAVRLTSENDGQTITLQVGQEMHVLLGGNLTTGYAWEAPEVDTTVLNMLGDAKYTAASDAIGSGGEFDFTFQAVAPGETELTLIYHRSFEKDVPPKRTFSVKVVVEP